MNSTTRAAATWALALCGVLAACGGGGDDGPAGTTAAGAGTGTPSGSTTTTATAGTTLTISNANPTVHTTTVNLATASSTNEARAADGFSSVPYCAVNFEAATGANGRKYSLLVYFRQTDLQPINLSLLEGQPPNWVLFESNNGAAISGVTVSTSARTLSFNNKLLTATGGLTATLSGTVGFTRNTSVSACGG